MFYFVCIVYTDFYHQIYDNIKLYSWTQKLQSGKLWSDVQLSTEDIFYYVYY